MIDDTELFGYLGVATLIVTLVPQLYLTMRTKKVNDLSFGFLCLQELTCIFFLIYGIKIDAVPLIVANSIVGTQGVLLLFLKIVYS